MNTVAIADHPTLLDMVLSAVNYGQCKTLTDLDVNGQYVLRVRLPFWEVSMLWQGVTFGDTPPGLRQFHPTSSQIAKMCVTEESIKHLRTHDQLSRLTTGRKLTAQAVMGDPNNCPSLAKIMAENGIAHGSYRHAIVTALYKQLHKSLSVRFAYAMATNVGLSLDNPVNYYVGI